MDCAQLVLRRHEYDEETDEEVGYYDEYWSGGVSFPNSKYYDLFEYVYEFDEESFVNKGLYEDGELTERYYTLVKNYIIFKFSIC